MVPESLQREAEQFLYHEASLIDSRSFDEWAALFTEDCLYWVPNSEEPTDEEQTESIIYDDREGIARRIRRLQHPATLTEVPPRRTRHFITSIMVSELDDGEILVRSNQIVYATRAGRDVQYPGSWEHTLRRSGEQWLIRKKTVCLMTSDRALWQLPVL